MLSSSYSAKSSLINENKRGEVMGEGVDKLRTKQKGKDEGSL
jgi:hypothetical protein